MEKPTHIDSESVSTDENTRALYRAVSVESAPPHLNNAVLELATREARRHPWFAYFVPWLRPAALAATVGLSLAVLLEVDEVSNVPSSVPKDDTGSTTPSAVLDDFASAAADSSSRIREIGETAVERNLPGEPSADADTGSEADARRFCDPEQSSAAESWQRCIELLLADGRTSEADAELARFREAYPDVPFHAE